VQGDAIADDKEDLGGEQEHPDREDDGVEIDNSGLRRRFMKESGKVDAETGEDSSPEQSQPDDEGPSVVARAPGCACMPR
jgi:hypothetical protein